MLNVSIKALYSIVDWNLRLSPLHNLRVTVGIIDQLNRLMSLWWGSDGGWTTVDTQASNVDFGILWWNLTTNVDCLGLVPSQKTWAWKAKFHREMWPFGDMADSIQLDLCMKDVVTLLRLKYRWHYRKTSLIYLKLMSGRALHPLSDLLVNSNWFCQINDISQWRPWFEAISKSLEEITSQKLLNPGLRPICSLGSSCEGQGQNLCSRNTFPVRKRLFWGHLMLYLHLWKKL